MPIIERRRLIRSARRLRAAADYVDGVPVKVIAETHGLHATEIYRIVARVQIAPRQASHRQSVMKRRAEIIREQYTAGRLIAEIAEALEISARTVRKFVTKLDLPRRHPAAWGRQPVPSA
jgi:transposase